MKKKLFFQGILAAAMLSGFAEASLLKEYFGAPTKGQYALHGIAGFGFGFAGGAVYSGARGAIDAYLFRSMLNEEQVLLVRPHVRAITLFRAMRGATRGSALGIALGLLATPALVGHTITEHNE